MSAIEKMQPGSFRGVPYLVNSETSEGGKKTVAHEFVNSNKRFTEEMGQIPPVFVLEVIVHGDDVIQKRINLERVLNISGLGDMVHPIYGNIQVKTTTFSVNSNQTTIGQCRFTINCETSEAEGTAELVTVPQPTSVSSAAEDAREAVDNALETNYADPEIPDTLEAAGDKLDSVYSDVFDSVSEGIGLVQEKLSTFTRTVEKGRDKVFSTVQKGSIVKDSIKELYNSAIDVVEMPQNLFNSWESLLDFGFDDIRGAVNTVFRRNKENNKSAFDEHTRITALINLHEAAAYKDFQTDQELDTAQKTLDDNYELFINNFDTGSDSIQSLAVNPEVRKTIAELRVRTRKVLNDKDQNTWRVVTIEPGISSMALTSFRYYGSLDNLDIIRTLNTDINAANFIGPIQAVSR